MPTLNVSQDGLTLSYSPLLATQANLSLANVGTGAGVYKQTTGTVASLRSIKAGANVAVVQNADDVTVSASPSGAIDSLEATVLAFSTTPASDVDTGLAFTPAAGTWLALFSGNFNGGSTGATPEVSLYKNAARDTDTIRKQNVIVGVASVFGAYAFQKIVAANGTDVFKVRMRGNGISCTMDRGTFTLIRLA